MFKAVGQYAPPPAGIKSPILWGTREHLVELFGAHARSISTELRNFMFRYRSAEHFIDVFRNYYGPVLKAMASLDEGRRNALVADLRALIDRLNKADDGTMVVPGEYLEVVIVKK